jgi:anthranilate synthase/aminodeoxychorismate synthase-like glutamine amidotransferase
MILVLDNYDSFTYNLVQLLGSLGADVVVRRNDELSADDIGHLEPDGIVISPGPCGPDQAGISVETVRRWGAVLPVLGVCLGHQAIARAYGGRVIPSPRPVHGKVHAIEHDGAELFHGLPNPVDMTRYHSLTLDPASLPPELEVTAWTGDPREIQGVRHRTHRVWGVQFHPESIASRDGARLLENFLELAR